MLKIFTLDQLDLWEKTAKSFKMYDIYFSPKYFIPFMNNGDGKPTALYFESVYGRVLHCFLTRDIAYDKYFVNILEKQRYFDISSVYGYGGPIYECKEENLQELSKKFYEEFQKYCIDQNIVSEFIRFHPILKNEIFAKNYASIENVRKTIYVDLTNDLESTWNNFNSNARKGIKKAIRNEVVIQEGINELNLYALTCLYNHTMDRNSAEKYYYFNPNFFKDTVKSLKNNCKLFTAVYKEKIIAASLLLYSDNYAHHHLTGSDEKYLDVSPNNLLIYEMIKWCIENNIKGFHMGGGHKSIEDSIYRYKKNFTKTPPLDFYIGKKIYDKAIYDWLIEKKFGNNSVMLKEDYFPLYRK